MVHRLRRMISVSYTHLDVYKRQHSYCIRLFFTLTASSKRKNKGVQADLYSIWERLKAGIEEILRTRVFVLIIVFCIMSSILVGRLFNLQIVNGQQYLDEDVYKRQFQYFRSVVMHPKHCYKKRKSQFCWIWCLL